MNSLRNFPRFSLGDKHRSISCIVERDPERIVILDDFVERIKF